jgi:thiamine biosynthesis lipoprotein
VSARVFETMGTVVSIRLPDGTVPESVADTAAAGAREVFRRYDRTFSLWDPTSPLSAIARGDAQLTAASEEIQDVYAQALEWRTRTDGAFTPHRPDGVVDLSGIVKALAIRDAGALLDDVADSWLLNAGGDVLVRGDHEGEPWSVGVVDPDRRDALAAIVPVATPHRALATSGTAERGEHVWRRSDPTFVQATVLAADIVTADVLATAVLAGDESDLRRLTARGDVDVLAFQRDGGAWATASAEQWCRRVA